jgi:hypothetical protein
MTHRQVKLRVNGKVVKVGFRLVSTPYRGYIVEFGRSTALLEIRPHPVGVILRYAYGMWEVDLLNAINDFIKTK